MLAFGDSSATKFVTISSQLCMFRRTHIGLNYHELHQYSFVIRLNRCDGSGNSVEDRFGKIYVFNKKEDGKFQSIKYDQRNK